MKAKGLRWIAALVVGTACMGLHSNAAESPGRADQVTGVFELWRWGDVAERELFCVVTNGARFAASELPDVLSLRLRVKGPHDGVSFYFQSSNFVKRVGFGPNGMSKEKSAIGDYRLTVDGWSFAPWPDHFKADASITLRGKSAGDFRAEFDIVPDTAPGAPTTLQDQVGYTNPFPPVVETGIPVEFQMWQWEPKEERKLICVVTNGSRIPFATVTTNWHLLMKPQGDHDGVSFHILASNQFARVGVGPQPAAEWKKIDGSLYRVYADFWSVPPGPDAYAAQVELTLAGKTVGVHHISFSIAPPLRKQGTTYLSGRKDYKGVPITCSKPVKLGALNETPKLVDTDYPFEPQRAVNVCNYERFPDFHMNPRFLLIYGSRHWPEETIYGGPLEHGFNTLSGNQESPLLATCQKVRFTYPGLLVSWCNTMIKKDPVRYADLKGWSEHRLPWMSASNAFDLGWNCGGEAVGIWGWDEEEMGEGAAVQTLLERPEFLPPELQHFTVDDPKAEKPETRGELQQSFIRAWADFLGNFYRGVRAHAGADGRGIKIFHYGSKVLGANNGFWSMSIGAGSLNPATGKYKTDEAGSLDSWFKAGDVPNFAANEYTRQLDFFAKDFYYWTIFPQQASMYEKNKAGNYVLDEHGRRKARRDVFEEKQYDSPTKIGYEDCGVTPPFMRDFIHKGENTLYWLNGGRYYKQSGTLVAKQRLIPTLRRGSQSTWPGDVTKLDSRPVSPYMAEANPIFTMLIGVDGFYYWDSCGGGAEVGSSAGGAVSFGELEYALKGMHRLSKFNKLFNGTYSFVRPVAYRDMWPHDDQTMIRGLINGRYLLLGMTNPYLDPGETQEIEIWYDATPDHMKQAIWKDKVTLKARSTHLFQCKLPALPGGKAYDPDKLFFRYTCVDGTWKETYTVNGNYDAPYRGKEK